MSIELSVETTSETSGTAQVTVRVYNEGIVDAIFPVYVSVTWEPLGNGPTPDIVETIDEFVIEEGIPPGEYIEVTEEYEVDEGTVTACAELED